MRPRTPLLVACLSAIAVVAPGTTRNAIGQVDQKTLESLRQIARAAAVYPPANIEQKVGAAAAKADIGTRKVWISALKVPGQQNEASAGFRIVPISLGAKISNAKVQATFDFAGATGGRVKPWVKVYPVGNPTPISTASGPEVQGGDNRTVETQGFDLQAGTQYRAKAYVEVLADTSPNYICAAEVTITEIKWVF